MDLLAGCDIGSSGVDLVLTDLDGTVVARASRQHPTAPGAVPGAVEQDPEDWWRGVAESLRETGHGHEVVALGLTGQMQDVVLVADDGAGRRPVRSALLYSDLRATAEHARLRAELPDWEQRTGNLQDPSNVPAKLAWLAAHESATLEKAERLLFGAPGYVAWRAGAEPACDVLTASTTGLLDVGSRGWAEDVLVAAGGRPELLPILVGSQAGDQVVGAVSPSAALELGVRAGVPIVLAAGDAGAATDGLVGDEPGDAYLSLGTTGWLAAVVPADPQAQPSISHSLVVPGWSTRLRVGAVQSAGATAAWARERFLPGVGLADAEAVVAERVGEVAARPLCLPGLAGNARRSGTSTSGERSSGCATTRRAPICTSPPSPGSRWRCGTSRTGSVSTSAASRSSAAGRGAARGGRSSPTSSTPSSSPATIRHPAVTRPSGPPPVRSSALRHPRFLPPVPASSRRTRRTRPAGTASPSQLTGRCTTPSARSSGVWPNRYGSSEDQEPVPGRRRGSRLGSTRPRRDHP